MMKIFKQEYKKSITEEWYQNGGREAIAEKVRQYRGRGIGSMYVSNLGLCPKGTDYAELAGYLTQICPATYWRSPVYPDQEDAILLIDAEGGVQHA